MPLLRQLTRSAKIIWLFASSATGLLITRPQSRRDRAAWLSSFCRRVLRAANVTYAAEGPVPEQGAVISNHLTYVDIMLHSALRPCVFVSAIETRRMPLLGWMSMMAGTVYVVRGAGGSAAQAAGGMADGFRDGLPVVFFPEGGTGVGDVPLLPLHSGLLANAIKADAPITAGFIRYQVSPEDLRNGKTTRDDVAWGKQKLLPHIWNLLGLRSVTAIIRFAPTPIPFSPAALVDRKTAAVEARASILSIYEGSRDKS